MFFLYLIYEEVEHRKEIKKIKEEYEVKAKLENTKIKAILNDKEKEYRDLESKVEKEKDYKKKLELVMRFIDEHLQD